MCGIYLTVLMALAMLLAWSIARRDWDRIDLNVRVVPPHVELDVRKDE